MIGEVTAQKALRPFYREPLGCRIVANQASYPDELFAHAWRSVRFPGAVAIGKLDHAWTVAARGILSPRVQQEVNSFLHIMGAQTVLMSFPPQNPIARGFCLQREGVVLRCTAPLEPQVPTDTPTVRGAFALMQTCFPTQRKEMSDAAYVDLSHRVRHRTARLCGVTENCEVLACAMTVGETPKAALLGGVCCAPSRRRQGYAGSAVSSLTRTLLREGKTVYLLAEPELVPFYQKLHFRAVSRWYEYAR